MFADDIVLFSNSADPLTSSQELTHAVMNVYNWLVDRGLQMNVKKTQAIFVRASARRSHKKTWLWACSAVIDSFLPSIHTNTSVSSLTVK